ncbi:DUF3006 domain-containing protein [Anaerofustis stercorihominis]|uniref:DUF3006 domain-containing protein n=1 Tax=Anaerofustis stercorihominis TaxID=214853 RepID=UPI00214CDC6B|nr:DUF3006 domain-containing protein [Anaerofustis stercorihominis]MCR2033041.1 DUF3006 domain-containing protein [Anaerofustis stercorihominis]
MIKGIIDRFENDKVVIEFEDLKIGVLPKNIFKKGIEEGDEVTLDIDTKHTKNIDIDELFK